MIMSSEPAEEAAEIIVAEGVQETDLKYLVAEVVEALDLEDSEYALFQFGGDSDQSVELPGKFVVKYDHTKTSKDGEKVIQAASNLVYLELVIKGAEEVRRNNRVDDLESVIIEDRGEKGDDFETF